MRVPDHVVDKVVMKKSIETLHHGQLLKKETAFSNLVYCYNSIAIMIHIIELRHTDLA